MHDTRGYSEDVTSNVYNIYIYASGGEAPRHGQLHKDRRHMYVDTSKAEAIEFQVPPVGFLK